MVYLNAHEALHNPWFLTLLTTPYALQSNCSHTILRQKKSKYKNGIWWLATATLSSNKLTFLGKAPAVTIRLWLPSKVEKLSWAEPELLIWNSWKVKSANSVWIQETFRWVNQILIHQTTIQTRILSPTKNKNNL